MNAQPQIQILNKLYHRITRRGSFDEDEMGNWTSYLERFRKYIEKGFQFTRLAVQEPYGVMILKVPYC